MKYNIAAVLEFVKNALMDEEVHTIALGKFPAVRFTQGMTFDHKVRYLVEYAGRHLELDKLVAEVAKLNPNVHARYASVLTSGGDAAANSRTLPETSEKPGAKCDILVLSANPLTSDRLGLHKEEDIIRSSLANGGTHANLNVQCMRAVRSDDLQRLLVYHNPTIVHFGGHGTKSGEIILEESDGSAHPVSASALAGLFRIASPRTQCVVLNACYSAELADELHKSVDCIVGMSRAIADEDALKFAEGFYLGIGSGKDYESAFEMGRNRIELANLPGVETPHFIRDQPVVVRPAFGPHRSDPMELDREKDVPLYPLWFGTNRRLVDVADASKGFGSERDNQLHFGKCKVVVPKSHRIGSLGSRWWKRLLTWTDDRLSLRKDTLQLLSDELIWSDIGRSLREDAPDDKVALIYIHGYNVDFQEAALRAAQLGVDLKVPGITAFYSWPSQGKLGGYVADEATIAASEQHIAEFLTRFAEHPDVQRMHVLAHSMGNRGILRSLKDILSTVQRQFKKPFGQVFLAAADVDVGVFENLAADYKRVAERTTLYVSSRDKALASSGFLHNYARAGLYPPVTVLPHIDTVACTEVDLTYLGHGYYADAREVLQDIHTLIHRDSPPAKRFGLREATTENREKYWLIGK